MLVRGVTMIQVTSSFIAERLLSWSLMSMSFMGSLVSNEVGTLSASTFRMKQASAVMR